MRYLLPGRFMHRRARSPSLRTGIGALDLCHADVIAAVPALDAEALRGEMLRVLLPGADRRLVREIGDSDAESRRITCMLGAETAGLLRRKLEHRLCHRIISRVRLFALRGENHRVIRRLGRNRE